MAIPSSLTYKTPISKIRHSAIASWSGYIYQGLCALHYALFLLRTNWDIAKTDQLNLEGYEDFSILDENGLIVSLHQCKCYNASHDCKDECEKMSDKHEYWDNQRKLSPNYNGLFFHTNQINTYSCGISSYQYNTANRLCSPSEISKLIEDEIRTIIQQRNIAGSSVSKQNRLVNFVIKHVEDLHKQQIQTQQDMFDIACANSIPFSKLIEQIEMDNDNHTKEEKSHTCRHYFILEMNCRLLTCRNVNGTKVVDFLKEFDSLDDFSLIQFVRRLFPDEDILNSSIDNISIRSKERADNLFNVINDVVESVDNTCFDWTRNSDNVKQSPSTLGSNKDPEEFCPEIIQNPYSNDLRRDYRWIVGDIKNKVDDIDEAAKQITHIDRIDYTDITQTKKVGLLDINSKNNGNY
jgi:hypothetical protein